MKPEVYDQVIALLARKAKRMDETDAEAVARVTESPEGKALYEQRKTAERQAPRNPDMSNESISASGALLAARNGTTKEQGVAAFLETPEGAAAYDRLRRS